jgi:hypothetical protein
MSLDALIIRILDEWQVVRGAFVSWLVAVMAAAGLVFLFLQFHWSGVLSQQQATIVRLQQDRTDLQQLNDRYKLELNLVPARNRFFYMSNTELQASVHDIIPKVIAFQDRWAPKFKALENDEEIAREQVFRKYPGPITSEESQAYEAVMQKYMQEQEVLDAQQEEDYDRDLKGEIIMLREEMLSRLPSTVLQRLQILHGLYAMPNTNEIITDLNSLMLLLPSDQSARLPKQPLFTWRDQVAAIGISSFLLGMIVMRAIRTIKKRYIILSSRRRRASRI